LREAISYIIQPYLTSVPIYPPVQITLHSNHLSMSGTVHTGVEVHRMDSEMSGLVNNLDFSLYTVLSVCCVVTTSDDGKKSKM